MRIESWTYAKSDDLSKNEDKFGANDDVFALADGATDKTEFIYPSGKSGGQELAELAVDISLHSGSSGYELIDEVTEAVQRLYKRDNPDALSASQNRAATTLVVARLVHGKLVITQVGDTSIRVTSTDGTVKTYTNDKLIDKENAALRSIYIKAQLEGYQQEHGHSASGDELARIVSSGRNVISERLKHQHIMQNSVIDEVYGYGIIDGSLVPREYENGNQTGYVKEITINDASNVSAVELVSDGFYGMFPKQATIGAYESLFKRLHKEDPYKYQTHLSTKSQDDATVLVANLID